MELGRTLMTSEVVAVLGMDAQGQITEWSGAAEALFGRRRETVLGCDLAEIIMPPDLRPAHRRALAARLESTRPEATRRLEQLAMRADGSEFAAAVSISQIPGTEPPVFLGLVRDVTGQREADFRLAKSQSLLAAAEAAGRSGSFDRDLRTGEAEWSAGVFRIYDLPVGPAAPSTEQLIELIHPTDRAAVREMFTELIRDRPRTFEHQWRLAIPDRATG